MNFFVWTQMLIEKAIMSFFVVFFLKVQLAVYGLEYILELKLHIVPSRVKFSSHFSKNKESHSLT